MALNINVTISNWLINKLKDPKVRENERDYKFLCNLKKQWDYNRRFKGYWFIRDPLTKEEHMVSVIDIFSLLQRKKNINIFMFDLKTLLSRGDGSGPDRVKDGTFKEGKFKLFEGAEHVLKAVKQLLEVK